MATGRTNRVAPDGSLHAVPERGGVFGNRGSLLGVGGRVVRPFAGVRWIACELEFRGRRRVQWQPGRYTELYLLDEATAFAAGHRPCAECRRPSFELFRRAWAAAAGLAAPPTAVELDTALHAARWADGARRTWRAAVADLPVGTVVADDAGGWSVVAVDGLRRWSFGGYGPARGPAGSGSDPVTVVTPRPTVDVLRAGYPVRLAPSVDR